MTSTIGEISGNLEKARRITEGAMEQAGRITAQIQQLSQAAQEIGKVTETLSEISAQTNLLGPECHHWGGARRLGRQRVCRGGDRDQGTRPETDQATEDIKPRAQSVPSSTAGGIAEIEKISVVFREVSDIVGSMAAAIEEQATVTKEISWNIAEASMGVRDGNLRGGELTGNARHRQGDFSEILQGFGSGSGPLRGPIESGRPWSGCRHLVLPR
jgi:methyl-accepting chemotaxis protein